MATISKLSVTLTTRTAGLKKGLAKAGNMVKRFTGKIANIKTALVGALGVLGAGALGKSAVDAFLKQDRAVTSFDASLKSMGRTTKGFSQQIKTLASQLQAEGIIGDEAILEGAAFLSTFGGITDELLPRTIRAMVDLAAKTGGGTVNAAKLLGKASMGLVGALSIAGISLSDATKKSKNFEDILREIEEQVGGTNAALGAATSGALLQFQNAWGDIMEILGEIILIAIGPWLSLFTQELAGNTISAQKWGEKLREGIKGVIASFGVLADIWETIKLAGNGIEIVVNGLIGGFWGLVHAAGTFFNFLARTTGKGENFFVSLDTMNQAESGMDRMIKKNQALDSIIRKRAEIAKELVGITDGTAVATPGDRFRAELEALGIKAEVADMKRRLGIAGGPNLSDVNRGTKSTPQIVQDPQLKETNEGIKTLVELFGKQTIGAFAG